jgi:hypothetical protein
MKNSNALSLVICIGILIVIGCSCPQMAEIQKELDKSKSSPSPTVAANTSTSPKDGDKDSDDDSSDLTLAKYNQLKNGMSLAEAQEIIGSDGKEVSSSEIGKYKTVTQKWDGENYAYIICTFQNDKLMFKSQGGIK